MAHNQENFTGDDTSEEIGINYRSMEANEDENDEGIVEYLDLDMECETLQDTEEYCRQIDHPPPSSRAPNKPRVQSSILKTNCTVVSDKKVNSRSKRVRPKRPVIIPERSIMRTRSSIENNGKNASTMPGVAARKSLSSHDSANVHSAVDDINSRLAISLKSLNGHITTDGRESADNLSVVNSRSEEPAKKSDNDGLDLFFQSMAQTVLTLPSQVQAKIKMDICKVIAMAEMKYGVSETSQ